MKFTKLLLSLSAALLAVCMTACAQEYTSIEDVMATADGGDFAIQGEYSVPEADEFYQVIARGDGKFDVVGYKGGLPGQGWDRSMARFFGSAELKDGKLVITGIKMDIPRKGEEREVIFTDEQKAGCKMAAWREGGKILFEKKGKQLEAVKLDRKSPTLGEKAPEGAWVIYDGSNTDNFLPSGDKEPEVNPENGALFSELVVKPFENRPYKLHLEFMTSYMPRSEGQGRANSGVYIDECYECQVLDSFGLEGRDNECGGFYQSTCPIVNMAFPPLSWQTYDIDFTPVKYDENGKKTTNARFTVVHNGVVIHDDIELSGPTPGRSNEEDTHHGLYLQGHGNRVQYRNIWVQYK
ncbi:MAG: DUF1080 domain-containing protein [Thermoguttaceae bacterium]|nr:DUF1080 domain-containing protein [Thermoguttaceae bacterium]